MTTRMKWIYGTVGAVVALAVIFGAAFAFARSSAASMDTGRASVRESHILQTGRVGINRPGLESGVWFGDTLPLGGYMEALAQALGITLDELEEAYAQAFEAAIEQALDEGVITQEQAERLSSVERYGMRGRRGFGGSMSDMNKLLAEALEISVSELEAAQEQARATVMAQAVEKGVLTQEEADLIGAREALQPYFEAAMSNAYESAVEQALADGVITQVQADLLLENREGGLPGFGAKVFSGGWGIGGIGGFMEKHRLP